MNWMNNRIKADMLVWAISYMLKTLTVYTVISAISDSTDHSLCQQKVFTTGINNVFHYIWPRM